MRNIRYTLGMVWAHQEVAVTFDPTHRQFVFTQVRSQTSKGQEQPHLEPVRREVKNLSLEDITGLPAALPGLPTRQLMFPLFMSQPQANFSNQGA